MFQYHQIRVLTDLQPANVGYVVASFNSSAVGLFHIRQTTPTCLVLPCRLA